MTDRELMQMALEALERCVATCFDAYAHEQVMSRPEHFVNQNITALRQALETEREWIGLTEDEIWKCNKAKSGSAVEFHICYEHQNVEDFAEAIEAKLKEKNHG
jgi:hypothetical protein